MKILLVVNAVSAATNAAFAVLMALTQKPEMAAASTFVAVLCSFAALDFIRSER